MERERIGKLLDRRSAATPDPVPVDHLSISRLLYVTNTVGRYIQRLAEPPLAGKPPQWLVSPHSPPSLHWQSRRWRAASRPKACLKSSSSARRRRCAILPKVRSPCPIRCLSPTPPRGWSGSTRRATSSAVSPSAGRSATMASATSSASRRRNWPDGRKVTAEQVARVLKRDLAGRSRNSLKDNLGAIEDIVAMTDRVIEISLDRAAPRPSFRARAAADGDPPQRPGDRPVHRRRRSAGGEVRLTPRHRLARRRDHARREQLLLAGAAAPDAVRAFAAGDSIWCWAGRSPTCLSPSARSCRANSLRFDPASGLFGLVPLRSGGRLDEAEVRQLLSQAIDRDAFVAALGVPGLAAAGNLARAGARRHAARRPPRPGPATPYCRPPAGAEGASRAGSSAKRRSRPSASRFPRARARTCCSELLQRDWGAARPHGRARAGPGGRRLRADRRSRAIDLAGLVRPPLPLRRRAGVRRGRRQADGRARD